MGIIIGSRDSLTAPLGFFPGDWWRGSAVCRHRGSWTGDGKGKGEVRLVKHRMKNSPIVQLHAARKELCLWYWCHSWSRGLGLDSRWVGEVPIKSQFISYLRMGILMICSSWLDVHRFLSGHIIPHDYMYICTTISNAWIVDTSSYFSKQPVLPSPRTWAVSLTLPVTVGGLLLCAVWLCLIDGNRWHMS